MYNEYSMKILLELFIMLAPTKDEEQNQNMVARNFKISKIL